MINHAPTQNTWTIPPSVRQGAKKELDALMARGALGARLEVLGRNFNRGALDIPTLAGLLAARGIFRITHARSLQFLNKTKSANLIIQGLKTRARSAAFVPAFTLEATLFPIATKASADLIGRDVDWAPSTTRGEIRSSFFVLGGLKFVGGAVGGLFNKIHGFNPLTGQVKRFETFSKVSRPIMPQLGMLGGMMLGHKADEWASDRKPIDGATTFTDSLAMLFQFNIAGNLLRHAFPRVHAWDRQQQLETYRLEREAAKWTPPLPNPPPPGGREIVTPLSGKPSLAEKLRSLVPSPLVGEGQGEGGYPLGLQPAWVKVSSGIGLGPRPARMPLNEPTSPDPWKNPLNIMMSSPEGPSGGAPRTRSRRATTLTTSIDRAMEKAVGEEIHNLEDLPQIRKALLPQTSKELAAYPGFETFLKKHKASLIKLDQTIGDETFPGAAPFVGRLLARRILGGKKSADLPLQEHPIARMVAESLATHYEAMGDLIGNQIYRDLHRVYGELKIPTQENLLLAEEIILKNLELDPFSPWYLHLGRWVSGRLGELAQHKPEYYEALKEEMERLPKKWRTSSFARSVEQEIVGRFRRKLVKATKEATGAYVLVVSLLDPVVKVVAGIMPTPGNLVKGLHYLIKLAQGAKNAPSVLEGIRKKTEFEILLYYGNYKKAVPLAEPGSKIHTNLEVLTRRRMGKRLEKKIRLEPIPQLAPHTVNQREALVELEDKLAKANLVNLEGIEGSANTYMAIQLAHQYKGISERPVFWYTLREDKSPTLPRLLDHLAHFLEMQNPVTEKGLLARIQEQSKLPPMLAIIRGALRRTPSLLFFDNFHVVLEDVASQKLFSELFKPSLLDTKVITITHRDSKWLNRIGGQNWHRSGMTRKEAKDLFFNLGVLNKLTPEQVEEAYQLTGRLPQGLILLGHQIRSSPPEKIPYLYEELRGKDGRWEVLNFLFNEVYDHLNENQKTMLHYISIFRDPVPKEALYLLGPTNGIPMENNLAGLKESFLIEERQEGFLELHRRYRALLSPRLNGSDTKELHRRAAEFFNRPSFTNSQTQFPSDFLEAGYHYLRAGEYGRSVRMISRSTTSLLRGGYYSRLEQLLNQFTPEIRLRADERAELNLSKGSFAHFQGDVQGALQFFRQSLKSKRRLDDHEGMAILYYKMGKVYDSLDQWKRALGLYEKSLGVRKKIRDYHGMFHTHMKIGKVYQSQGEWKRAYLSFRKSLSLHQEKLKDPFEEAQVYFNMAKLEKDRGNFDQAKDYLTRSFEIFRRLKAPEAIDVVRVLREIKNEEP